MSYKELLVLRKILTKLLDKQFIYTSNLPTLVSMLFIYKLGGRLWFYIDYKGLNTIIRKDWYLLLLIIETLKLLSKAKWLIKLNIIIAFHKIRVKDRDEWKTIFRIYYSFYK